MSPERNRRSGDDNNEETGDVAVTSTPPVNATIAAKKQETVEF